MLLTQQALFSRVSRAGGGFEQKLEFLSEDEVMRRSEGRTISGGRATGMVERDALGTQTCRARGDHPRPKQSVLPRDRTRRECPSRPKREAAPRRPRVLPLLASRGGDLPSSRGAASRTSEGFFGGEGADGEEGVPEAAFGGGVFHSRGERGEPEAGGPLCPIEPGALWALRERRSGERVV